MNPNDENKVIGPRKPNEVSKSPWKASGSRKPKESKWAKDAQEKDKRDTGAYK